ncbi:MAG: serine/threonine protein kinase, partial [Acidobacteria bacterium]|nr:serine/threonine protein kinase [Acidobacteriota bacterium]
MKAERFRQIRNLFDAALERDQESRNAFLKEACQGDEELLMEVGKLLASHGEPTSWIDESVLGEPLPRMEGKRVGPYEILRQLGEGGMGSVYLAARADGAYRKTVALKIVRPAAATTEVLRRFQREREILATLDHPNIARITDGGTTEDGLPYLVMDYVEGEPIDAYCDRHGLDLKSRLELFRDVCSAVQYAHDHHVVHRDLKPTNILVTNQGVVKLLDFGIAKSTGSEFEGATVLTRSDMCVMTPEYASPEQVTGGSTTPSTDVYSLGVVLYELLTGRRPYRMQSRIIHEIVRVISEEPPTRPSQVKRQLRGDVECILLRALEKDPSRRYRSANAFSEDVRSHLEGLDVEASHGVTIERIQQFIGRHVWALLSVATLLIAEYNRLTWLPPAFFSVMLVFVVAGAYAAARHIYGKEFVRSRVPGIAKGVIIITLIFVTTRPSIHLVFGILAALNAYTFYKAFLWMSRANRLGGLVQNLRVESAQRKPGFGMAAWIVGPMIVLLGVPGILSVAVGWWRVGGTFLLLAVLFSFYLWKDSHPSSRETALGRPSWLGLAFMIVYFVL